MAKQNGTLTAVEFQPTDPVALAQQMCDVYSVSGHETELADRIEATLRTYAPHLRVERLGDTVIARTQLGRDRRVVLAGHIDTVPVNGNLPSERRVDEATGEEVLWGRGTVDMKSGAAVLLSLACALTAPAVDLTWVWYDHEEVGEEHNGLRRVVMTRPELLEGDFAVLAEPSGDTVEGGCNGTLWAEVVYRGTQAHSARGWTGVNAIHRAGHALAQLDAFEADTVCVDGLDYREGLNAVDVRGGVAANIIPDEAVITVNYRFAPSRSETEASAIVRDFFADADEVRITDVSAGARPGLNDPLASELVRRVGREPQAKLGWTDVARFSALGIAAVNFGPGDPALCHTDDERVPIHAITRCYETLYHWLEAGS